MHRTPNSGFFLSIASVAPVIRALEFTMESSRAISIIERQMALIPSLKQTESYSDSFKKWMRDTEVALERIFGCESRHKTDFSDISYSLSMCTSSTPDSAFEEAYRRGLDEANSIPSSMIDEIKEYGFDEDHTPQPDSLSLVENICNRFHLAVRQLRDRYNSRTTLEVEDEYDVQDLLHSMLHLHFSDIRKEEYSPSYAGANSRHDFLLKSEQLVIEVKKTRKGLSDREVGEQLIIDIARYRAHPDCKCLVCFVYDPEGRIGNPRGLEADLSKSENGFTVRTIIGPKGV